MIEKAIPQTFDDYIGQDKAKETLQIVLESTTKQINDLLKQNTKEAQHEAAMYMPPSILLIGPPGYGKTRLARIYAEDMNRRSKKYKWPIWAQNNNGKINQGVQNWNGVGLPDEPYSFAAIEGKDIKTAQFLDHYLYYLQIQGVLFIDECQSIPSKFHEHFLRIMTEQKYYSEIGDGLTDHFGFTLISATTHEGKIFRPFLERFKLVIMMEPYTSQNIEDMVVQYCSKMGYSVQKDALSILVDRSRNNPRTVTQNLDILFMFKESKNITKYDALKATSLRGIHHHGLTTRDAQILKILSKNGPLGEEALSEMVDAVDVKNYKVWERYLIHRQFVIPTKSGRIITNDGKKALEAIEKEEDQTLNGES